MGKRGAGEGNVRRRADGRYEAARSIGPRGRNKRISGYGATRQEAIDDLEAKVRQHRRRVQLETAADWTVAELVDWWIDEELAARVADQQLAPRSRSTYARVAKSDLVPALGHVPVQDLKPVHVRRLLDDARRAGRSPHARRTMHAVLGVMMSAAFRYELIDSNPVQRIEPPKLPKKERRDLTLEQARALLAAADGDDLEALWRLMLGAPLRPGEPTGAVWDDFNLDAGTYRVRRNLVRDEGEWLLGDLKNHEERTVPLTEATVAALRRHRTAQNRARLAAGPRWSEVTVRDHTGALVKPDLVFRMPRGPMWESTLFRRLAKLCDAAEVPRINPHGLRHAAVTLLTDGGAHPRVIQQLAGHSSLELTDKYTGVLEAQMREAVESLGRSLAGDG